MHKPGDTRQGAKDQPYTVQGSALLCARAGVCFCWQSSSSLREKPLPSPSLSPWFQKTQSSRQAGKHSGLPPPPAPPQVILKMTVIGVCFGNTLVPRITVLIALGASSSSFYQEARDVIGLGKERSAQELGHSGFSQ